MASGRAVRSARHLVVFGRVPRLGVGKRRLAAGIGDVAAWRIARALAERTLRRLGRGPWRCWLCLAAGKAEARPRMQRLWPSARAWRRTVQARGDLGRRMLAALAALPPGPALLVGTDIPDIDVPAVAEAFRLLGRDPARIQAVLGPAEDGGYWLIGLARTAPRCVPLRLLDGARWSTAQALADSERALAGLGIVRARRLGDIDDAAALARWRARRGP